MYKKILFILIVSVFNISIASNKSNLYNQIIKNKPSINKSYARKLATLIGKISKKHNIPANIYCAILMQESGYKLSAKRKVSGVYKGKVISIVTDYGIGQIHWKTALRYKFNRYKLTHNLRYSIEAGARVLSWFKVTYKKRDKYWWTMYNCGNKSDSSRMTCQIYRKKVEQYL